MKNSQYKVGLTRPKPEKLRGISTLGECARAYSLWSSDERELGYKSFHLEMENFLRSELEKLLNARWPLPKKMNLTLTITED